MGIDDFKKYFGEDDSLYGYSRSYKLVLYKILFSDAFDERKSYLNIVANKFKRYYINRKQLGKVADANVVEQIKNIENSSDNEILDIIIKNPYKYINEKGFLVIDSDENGKFFKFNFDLTKDDIVHFIYLTSNKLNLYFNRIDSNNQKKKIITKPQTLNDIILERFSKLQEFEIIDTICHGEEEYNKICNEIKSLLITQGFKYLILCRQELLTLFLVQTGKYHYNDGEGGFWSSVDKIFPYISINDKYKLIDVFNNVIKHYHLPNFKNYTFDGLKLIGPILCHSGIPLNCLDSFLDVIFQLQDVKFSQLDGEILFYSRYADKPVKRYISFLIDQGTLSDEVEKYSNLINIIINNEQTTIDDSISEDIIKFAKLWANTKKEKSHGVLIKTYSPELTLDTDALNLDIKLPEQKLKDTSYIIWDIQLDNDRTIKRKIYGNQITDDTYIFRESNIAIPTSNIIDAKIYNDNNQLLDSYIIKGNNEIIRFDNDGKQNKTKYLKNKNNYFLCSNEFLVSNNLNKLQTNTCLASIYLMDNSLSIEAKFTLNDTSEIYVIKETPELIGGKRLFNGNAHFKRITAYSELPYIEVPSRDIWEITTYFEDEREELVKENINIILIKDVIIQSFGELRFGRYKIRLKNERFGYFSYTFAYLPNCSLINPSFYPNNNGYLTNKINFNLADGIELYDTQGHILPNSLELNCSTLNATLNYENIYLPFYINLRAFSWSLFNESQTLGIEDQTSYISTNDLIQSDFVMLNFKNHTKDVIQLQISDNNQIYKSAYCNPNHHSCINLKEYLESYQSTNSDSININIAINSNYFLPICIIKQDMYVRNFTYSVDQDGYLLKWDEDGPAKNREIIISELLKPYIKTHIPIEDGIQWLNLNHLYFDNNKDYLIEIRPIIESSIFEDTEKIKLTNDNNSLIIYKVNKTSQNIDFKELYLNISFSNLIESYIIHKSPKIKTHLSLSVSEYEISKLIDYRIKYGDAKLHKLLFKYEISENIYKTIADELSLYIPYYIEKDNIEPMDLDTLKNYNIVSYCIYLYKNNQYNELINLFMSVNKFKDNEPWVHAKIGIIFPKYASYPELLSDIMRLVNNKKINKEQALIQELINLMLDDVNPRILRTNKDYNNAIYKLLVDYQYTLITTLLSILASKR